MSRSHRDVARSGLVLTSGFALTKLLQLGSQVLLARLLAPRDFGIWAMLLIFVNLAAVFREQSIATVLVQEGLDDERLVNAVYSLGVNVSLGLFVLQAAAAYPLAWFFGVDKLGPLAAVAGLVFLINMGTGSHTAVLQRRMEFSRLAMADIVAGLARVVGAIGAAFLGAGVWSFVAGEIAMTTTEALMKRKMSGYRFHYQRPIDSPSFRKVRSYISGILAVDLAAQVNGNTDNLFVGRLLGAQSLGYYSTAYQLAMFPAYAFSQVNRVHHSALARLVGPEQQSYVAQTLAYYAMLAAPVYAAAFIVSPPILLTLYGSRWAPLIPLFRILLIFAYLRGAMAILGTCLNAAGRPWVNARMNWAMVPLSIPAYWFGARLGEARGVAISVVVVMGLGATLCFLAVLCRTLGWKVAVIGYPLVAPTLVIFAATVLAILSHLPVFAEVAIMLAIYLLTMAVTAPGSSRRIAQKALSFFTHPASEVTQPAAETEHTPDK